MSVPVPAVLLETSNPGMTGLKGRRGDLYCEVGLRCVFDGLLTSVVEGLVWFGPRVEIYTHNSHYVFEVETA